MKRNVVQLGIRSLNSVMCLQRSRRGEGSTTTLLACPVLLRTCPGLSHTLRTVAKAKCLAVLAPEIAAQWHLTKNGDVTPSDVASQTHKKYRWQCKAGLDHEWEASPANRVEHRKGCPCCTGRKVSVSNSLATRAPDVAAQWHVSRNGDVTPADITSGTNKKYWWRCDLGPDHEWEASPANRVGRGTGGPFCSGHKVSATNRLATNAPEVAVQWHPTRNGNLTAVDVTSGTSTMYWWLCDVDPDHEWEASSFSRVSRGRGCPCCSGRKVMTFNNLVVTKPSAAMWSGSGQNDCSPEDVRGGSNKLYWFKLPGQGLVQRSPRSFEREDQRVRLLGQSNTLASAAPEVAAQWHPTRNGDTMPADVASQTNRKYWWLCDAGPNRRKRALVIVSTAPAALVAAVVSYQQPTGSPPVRPRW
jgi:hypothetical protein